MKQFTVSENEEGRRLDKYIRGILKDAPQSFAYRMLRKKNIVLNGNKADGSMTVHAGDTVTFYLSDETFDKFSSPSGIDSGLLCKVPPIIYEDEDIIIADKPAGMLTQKSSANDISLNEILNAYIGYDKDEASFTPSVCNRLDRNTSGLVTFAKTLKGAKYLSDAFKRRTVGKYYTCIVSGVIEDDITLSGKLVKDRNSNTVTITDKGGDGADITTVIHPVCTKGGISRLEIKLITGKTHQIRAHLASIGHPIIGDPKYGDPKINDKYRKNFGITCQMLTCTRMEFCDDSLLAVSGKTIETGLPLSFKKVM